MVVSFVVSKVSVSSSDAGNWTPSHLMKLSAIVQ